MELFEVSGAARFLPAIHTRKKSKHPSRLVVASTFCTLKLRFRRSCQSQTVFGPPASALRREVILPVSIMYSCRSTSQSRHGVAHLEVPLRLGSVRSSALNKHFLYVNSRSDRGLRIRGPAGDFVRSSSRPCSFRQSLYVPHRLCAPHLSLEVNAPDRAVGVTIHLAKHR